MLETRAFANKVRQKSQFILPLTQFLWIYNVDVQGEESPSNFIMLNWTIRMYKRKGVQLNYKNSINLQRDKFEVCILISDDMKDITNKIIYIKIIMNSSSLSVSGISDKAQIITNKEILEQFENGEKILLSTLIIKVNQNQKKQERTFLITNKYVYNIVPKSDSKIMQIFGKIMSNQIKRKIKLSSIQAVSVTSLGAEFVIHVPSEYDYRFQSSDYRKQILETLCQCYQTYNQRKLPFFFKDDFTLVSVCTTENDVKKGIKRFPTEQPIELDVKELREHSNRKPQEQLIYKRPGLQKQISSSMISIEDFDLIKVLGRGAFGKVMMCEKKDSKELFAIKSLRKEHIMDKNQVEHTRAERKLLEEIDNPFLISLEYAFQTQEKLFFVMRFMRGGELFKHLRDKRRFPEQTAQFYAASILLALEYLHKMQVVYRDLKPENILMDEYGYIKMTDYGLAKFLKPGDFTYSFVGTPEYLAPEIIRQNGHSLGVDWWSFGILIYEMLVGRPPFFSQNQSQLFKSIVESDVVFPSQLTISNSVKDLITKLLTKNPFERLGHNGDAQQIKEHPWFREYPFQDLINKKLQAPIVPKLYDKLDVQNFDQEFTREEAMNSVVNMDPKLIEKFKQDFGGVTYVPNNMGLQ
ncbi:unnamed protein product [Paramecium octaurelia]|uniref:non-specific serine/threonine protein kinase n=1 Tax=Paramecium octaurelia TaxID=43137 RepID=A0A8S1VMX3_PAROT|nr:unnamed protein product [Paramecium octaurelia]